MRFKSGLSTVHLVIICLCALVLVNTYFLFLHRLDPIFIAKQKISSFSKGEQYIGRLQLWHILAQAGDWTNAAKLESHLDPADYSFYKDSHQPDIVKKSLNELMTKANKTPDDWIQLSQYYLLIGNIYKSKDSLLQAQKLDPIRSDVENLIQLFPL